MAHVEEASHHSRSLRFSRRTLLLGILLAGPLVALAGKQYIAWREWQESQLKFNHSPMSSHMPTTRSAPPLLAALLVTISISIAYIGSYFAMVVPEGVFGEPSPLDGFQFYEGRYRFGAEWAESFYWPLEQMDRQLRQEAWRKGEWFH
ncbi:hypothetical protein NA78x_004474 [Anatilimnocola sp. NA78]|uniref:hypothetical protein n=1 Tax=Anatilimnocola sp. NA78 TaxID=3415683 RepID=UPI003CE486DD